jgi:hypothetical protein
MATTGAMLSMSELTEDFETLRTEHAQRSREIQDQLRQSLERCHEVRQMMKQGKDGQASIQESFDKLELFIAEAGHDAACPMLQRKLEQEVKKKKKKNGYFASSSNSTASHQSAQIMLQAIQGEISRTTIPLSSPIVTSLTAKQPKGTNTLNTNPRRGRRGQPRRESRGENEEGCKEKEEHDYDIDPAAAGREHSRIPAAVQDRLQFVRRIARQQEPSNKDTSTRRKRLSTKNSNSRRRLSEVEEVREDGNDEEGDHPEKEEPESSKNGTSGEVLHDEWTPICKNIIQSEETQKQRASSAGTQKQMEEKITSNRASGRRREEQHRRSGSETNPGVAQESILASSSQKHNCKNPSLEPSLVESSTNDCWSFEPMLEGVPPPSLTAGELLKESVDF